jgi:CelD/BcsL family acetyltransferase involved in cellulose biosynthesis
MLCHDGANWARLSPGRSFLWELVRWCVENTVETLDLCVGDGAYKRYWCERQMRLFRCQYPLSARSAAFLASQKLKSWASQQLKFWRRDSR